MPRLKEIHTNLVDRLAEGWLGEVAAIETLAAADQKLEAMRAAHNAPVCLGMSDIRTSTGQSSATG